MYYYMIMQNTILGFMIMIIAAMSVLEQIGLIDVLGKLTFLYAVALVLMGLLMILRAQGKMASDKAEKKAVRAQEKMKKQLAAEHQEKEKVLEQKIEEKEQIVHQQEEVIDDMVNPKQNL